MLWLGRRRGSPIQQYATERSKAKHKLEVRVEGPSELNNDPDVLIYFTNQGEVSEANLAADIRFSGSDSLAIQHFQSRSEPLNVIDVDVREVEDDEVSPRGNLEYRADIQRLAPGNQLRLWFRVTGGTLSNVSAVLQGEEVTIRDGWRAPPQDS